MAIDSESFRELTSIAFLCSRFAVRSVPRRPQSDGYSPTAPTSGVILLIVLYGSPRRFAQFHFIVHRLNERPLLF